MDNGIKEYGDMWNPLTGDPELDKDLIEERQREILQQVEADEIAEGENIPEGTYRPVTDDDNDFVPGTKNNPNIHGNEES
jgi:hypothetical protein